MSTQITADNAPSISTVASKGRKFASAKASFAPRSAKKGSVDGSEQPEFDSHWSKSGVGDDEAVLDFTGDDKSVNQNPGKMSMRAKISLHSHLAINMFRGRKGDPKNNIRPIIGLARFARQVSYVWNAAADNDPYADLCLLEIESAFEEARCLIDGREKALDELLTGIEDFSVEFQTSERPVEIVLDFYCPWAYRTALLLRQFDKLVRVGLTARHLGLMSPSEWEAVVMDSGRALRHVFAIVNRWVNTGVRREDIAQNNKVAQRAIGKYVNHQRTYVNLPQNVLLGLERAKLSPKNQKLEELNKDSVKAE